LGCDFISAFNLVSLNAITGTNSVAEFHLKGDESNLHGKIFPPRSLSHNMRLKVEEDIRQKLRSGVLVPCKNPIVAAPIVPVVKSSGAVRVCGDYALTTNKIIDCGSYHIPSFDEIIQDIGFAKFYSRIDLKEAYLQVPLSAEAQRYTTISTHLGHFSYTRLPFGISASPRVFQEFMDDVLRDIPGVRAYQDDILVGGGDLKDHDLRLNQFEERLKLHKLIPSVEKSVYRVNKVKFLGFILENGQIKPDPERLLNFEKIRSPASKQELHGEFFSTHNF